MKKDFSKKVVIIILGLIICLGLMTFSVVIHNRKNKSLLIQRDSTNFVTDTTKLLNYPASFFKKTSTSISQLFSTYSENKQLKKSMYNFLIIKNENEVLKNENKQLRKELKLNDGLSSYVRYNANVIARTPSTWQQQLIIDKGYKNGVVKNMPVMSQNGLVGRVIEVNGNNSKVELITDNSAGANKFSVQINSNNSVVNGIISNYSDGYLVINQLSKNSNINVGDSVLTNGLGGITPKGLYIGKVYKIVKNKYDLSEKLYVKPAEDLNNIDFVTVLGKK